MFVHVMAALAFALFETPIGSCGIAWSNDGVAGVQLPERTEDATRARLRRRYPEALEAAPPDRIRPALDGIRDLLRGEKRDLSDVPVDLAAVSPFQQRLYAVLRTIPAGDTISYGELATRLGEDITARDVGEAMGQNPVPIIVPCHRVVAAGGKLGGFSAAGGVTTKLRLLEIEGAHVGETPTLFDSLPLAAKPRRR